MLDYREFGYRSVTIQQPLRSRLEITEFGIETALGQAALKAKLTPEAIETLRGLLTENLSQTRVAWIEDFKKLAKAKDVKLTKALLKLIFTPLTVKDAAGEIVKDSDGNAVYDPDLKQVENVPFLESVQAYFDREVKPFVPEAVIDRMVTDPKEPVFKDEKGNNLPKTPGIVGYEVNFNKYFYKYTPPRDPEVIAKEIVALEEETGLLMKELF